MGEPGSASGAIAVKWLASGTNPNRVATPAAPQRSTMVLLWRKYSALSFSPTTASRLPRLGTFQNNGLAARPAAWPRGISLFLEVSTPSPRPPSPQPPQPAHTP